MDAGLIYPAVIEQIRNQKQRCQFPILQPVAELPRNQRGEIARQYVKGPLAAASVHV